LSLTHFYLASYDETYFTFAFKVDKYYIYQIICYMVEYMKRQFDAVLLGSIELFCLAAELKSFTAAANAAGVTPAAVSRSITRLEERLGVRLFVRSTRHIRLTESGDLYFHHCKDALSQLIEAETEVAGLQSNPSGTIRISLPTTYGHYRILPILADFKSIYPNIKLDLHITNRNINFLDEGFDLAVRGRVPPDSNFISRKIEDAELVVVATRQYISKYGCPNTIQDLRNHDCIQFELPSTGRPIPWLFYLESKEHDVLTTGNYRCSEDVLGGVTLAKTSAGLFQTYRYVVERDLENGTLVEVLKEFSGRSRPFNLMYPHGKFLSIKVRTFIDFVMQRLSN
jgi:DNA-binding transcriptional LysR family regulator